MYCFTPFIFLLECSKMLDFSFFITILLFCLSEIYSTKYSKWVHNTEVLTSRTSVSGNLVVLTLLSLHLFLLLLSLLLSPFCTLLQFACAVPRRGTHIGGLGPTQWKGGALDLKRRVVLCCWCVALFLFFFSRKEKWASQSAGWEFGRRDGETKGSSALENKTKCPQRVFASCCFAVLGFPTTTTTSCFSSLLELKKKITTFIRSITAAANIHWLSEREPRRAAARGAAARGDGAVIHWWSSVRGGVYNQEESAQGKLRGGQVNLAALVI